MSASLVGSEMCIRDSFPPALGQQMLQHVPLSQIPIAGLSQPASHANASVSYTHLTLPTICSV
eukprot:12854433-Alexandrium_andersonii.AAC.1